MNSVDLRVKMGRKAAFDVQVKRGPGRKSKKQKEPTFPMLKQDVDETNQKRRKRYVADFLI